MAKPNKRSERTKIGDSKEIMKSYENLDASKGALKLAIDEVYIC